MTRIRLVVLAFVLTVAPAALAQPPLLVQEQGVTVDGAMSDRFTWYDASSQPRSASLAHNNVADPTGNFGGKLWQYTYVVGPGTRIVRAAQTSVASGFGYVVSHANNLANCLGDDSPLGHAFPGTFTRVFQGRHHAIFQFNQNYPRNCTAPPAAPATLTVPVTIQWVFATGRDHPLWAVTWDLSGVTAGLLNDDSRGPYGEMLFDGSATAAVHSMIQGVAWGDRYKFQTPGLVPVTYNSAWDYTLLNSVPYVKLWTTAVDATMGTVQTQTIQQHDAGGGFGFGAWGTSSAGNACAAGQEFPGPPAPSLAHVMPCSFNWPYQSINYSMGQPGGGNNNVGTNNTRLAWGAPFGFLGQTTYDVLGSVNLGGPVGSGAGPYGGDSRTAVGHPRNSYSVFVVLGLDSLLPVEAQRIQIEYVQATVLSAAIGSVPTTGPAGVNRSDLVTYAPAGWNHVYGAWALRASGNQIDANFNVTAGSLVHPLIIVSGWTGGLPSAVRFNGLTLTQDVHYFPSLRASAQELWITLNRTLSGATNRLEILPPPRSKTYTVPPCRVLDTRFSSPPGPIGGAAARDVRVVGPLGSTTQGGAPDCGVPTGATGVHINVVAVGAAGPGHLTAYPAGSALPLASTINFSTGDTVANGVLLPVCVPFASCAADLTIQMGPSAAHVVIDVTGYLAP